MAGERRPLIGLTLAAPDMPAPKRSNPLDRSPAVLSQLDAIEAEMRRIGFWADKPPDLQAAVQAGEVRSFLDAPSFELWLQCIFIPNARVAANSGTLPTQSQVGLMAMRQYDYHSHVPEAQGLLQLLQKFDALIEGRSS